MYLLTPFVHTCSLPPLVSSRIAISVPPAEVEVECGCSTSWGWVESLIEGELVFWLGDGGTEIDPTAEEHPAHQDDFSCEAKGTYEGYEVVLGTLQKGDGYFNQCIWLSQLHTCSLNT